MTRFARVQAPTRLDRHIFNTFMRVPMLSASEEKHLATRWRLHKDEAAMHTLIRAYLKLVMRWASRFRRYGLPLGDLVQEGTIGLLQAAARFDPDRNIRFSTYASWWVRSAIQDYVLRNWSIVRSGTSANQKSLFFKLRWMKARFADLDSTDPTNDRLGAIARDLGMTRGDVAAMSARLTHRDQSLNAPIALGSVEEVGTFIADGAPSPEDRAVARDEILYHRRQLAVALSHLNRRERAIIRGRFLRERRLTLEQLGVKFGVTKERIRQIEKGAFSKLRAALDRTAGFRDGPASA